MGSIDEWIIEWIVRYKVQVKRREPKLQAKKLAAQSHRLADGSQLASTAR